jgi:hypothetical protein
VPYVEAYARIFPVAKILNHDVRTTSRGRGLLILPELSFAYAEPFGGAYAFPPCLRCLPTPTG